KIAPRTPPQKMAGRKLADAPKNRLSGKSAAINEYLVQNHRVYLRRNTRQCQQGLGLRREEHAFPRLHVEQRPNPHAIAGQEHLARDGIPNGERELTVEALETIRPEFLERMQEYFGVRIGGEPVTPALQIGTQLDEIEDFAIEHDPHRAVLVLDGL